MMVKWTFTRIELACRINGLYPWPASNFEYEGTIIKVGLADFKDEQELESLLEKSLNERARSRGVLRPRNFVSEAIAETWRKDDGRRGFPKGL